MIASLGLFLVAEFSWWLCFSGFCSVVYYGFVSFTLVLLLVSFLLPILWLMCDVAVFGLHFPALAFFCLLCCLSKLIVVVSVVFFLFFSFFLSLAYVFLIIYLFPRLFSFFSSYSSSFPSQLEVVAVWLPLWDSSKLDFCNFCALFVGTFFWYGSCISQRTRQK